MDDIVNDNDENDDNDDNNNEDNNCALVSLATLWIRFELFGGHLGPCGFIILSV